MVTARITVLLTLLAAGCGAEAVAEEPPDLLRLIDLLEAQGGASVARAGEAAPRAPARIALDEFGTLGAETLVFGPQLFGRVIPVDPEARRPAEPPRCERRDGRDVLVLRPTSGLLRLIPLPGDDPVRIELVYRGTPRVPPSVYEVRTPLTAEALQDPDELGTAALKRCLSLAHPFFTTDEDEDGFVHATAWVRPGGGTHSLLVGASAHDAELELDRLEVRRMDEEAVGAARAVADTDEFRDPRIVRTEVHGLQREAILLEAPGELVLRATLPLRDPLLTLHVAPVRATDAPVTLEVEVNAVLPRGAVLAAEPAVRAQRLRIPARPATWHPLELDLAELAGREVELRFRARRASGGDVEAAGPLVVALGTPTVEDVPEADELPPDVVLLSMDTVRRDRLSLYGAERPTSPSLDALAGESVVFESAISTSSWTLPAHVSVFTGQLPLRHGVDRRGRRLAPGRAVWALPEAFRAAGYETIAYTAGGFVHPDFGLAVGFERYGTEELVLVETREDEAVRVATTPPREELLDALRGERRRPLFAFVHTYGAHGYRAATADLRAIGVTEDELAAMEDHVLHPGEAKLAEDWGTAAEPLATIYDASLVGVDALVGDVAGALREAGRWDDSWLFVFSDHGEQLFEHGEFGHAGKLVEELIRVPLLVHGPGVVPARVEEVVSLADLAPTAAEVAGLELEAELDGRSLAPLLFGDTLAPRPALSSVVDRDELVSLRTEELKVVASLEEGAVVGAALYDVAHDPDESRDLARERGDDRRRLVRALEARLEQLEGGGAHATLRPSAERGAELEALGYVGED